MNTAPRPYSEEEAALLPPERTGGKAGGLVKLRRADAPVPPWRLLASGSVMAGQWNDPAALETLTTIYADLSRPPFAGVMVRSSATIEDQRQTSAAGRFLTVQAIHPGELPGAIERVRDSLGGAAAEMAVVLQAAVPATLSGVMFSAHPAGARLDEAYAEVVRGAGEALMCGAAEPTRIWVSLRDAQVLRVEPGTDGPDTLDAERLSALCAHLLAAEEVFECPLDLEWCATEDGLWIVQARPITALQGAREDRPQFCATSWFLDQRFLDPISPLTYTSLLPLILRTALIEPLSLRGESPPAPLYARYAGQAYIAHEAHRRLLGGIPRCLLSPDLRVLLPQKCPCPALRRPPVYAHLLRFAWRQWRDALGNHQAWARFQTTLEARLEAVPHPPPENALGWRAAWHTLDALSLEFLRIHRWSLVLADYGFWAFRALHRCLPRAWRQRREEALLRSLHLPTERANATLRHYLHTGGHGPRLVLEFGHRSPSLDYAAPTWRELLESEQLHDHYAALAGAPAPEPRAAPGHAPWGWHALRRLLEMREEQRLAWERILARQRQLLVDAGAHLERTGQLASGEDVWSLEWNELCSGLEGKPLPDAAALRLRRHQCRVEQLLPHPLFLFPDEHPVTTLEEHWNGMGASGGVARGQACIINRLHRLPTLPPGPIIALVPALDPAHTSLLTRVQGLVVERGGLLSHAAILAREYGVPMVVGVSDARRHVRPGDWLEVDGEHGLVRRVTPPESE